MERVTMNVALDLNQPMMGFEKDCELRGMTKESVRRYRSSLLIFADFLKSRGFYEVEIDKNILKDFLNYIKFERKVKYKTIENYFSALSALYNYLVDEGIVKVNPVLHFRKKYLKRYKEGFDDPERKLLSVEDASKFVNTIIDPRNKAIAMLLAKTGIRRDECLRIDVEDINWIDYSINLKPKPKRSNRVIFFDDECAIILKRWLSVREKLNPETNALFVSYQSLGRLDRNGLYTTIVKHAIKLGFYDSGSPRLEDHFGPHCFRHWFTTWLIRNGMPREYVKELRGDRRSEAIDLYHHIDREDLRRAYLAHIPKLGI